MSEHTKEPWVVTGGERIKYIEARIGNGMLQEIASCMIVEHGNHEANARRIVACINACSEIPTEDLEESSMTILEYFEDHYAEKLEKLQKQRDELLIALNAIRSGEIQPATVARFAADVIARITA